MPLYMFQFAYTPNSGRPKSSILKIELKRSAEPHAKQPVADGCASVSMTQ